MKTIIFSLSIVIAGCGGTSSTKCDRTEPGTICTIAGMGESGYSGDEGAALAARLSLPMGTLTASDGTLYVDDWNNHRIRQMGADGMIHFVAGNGEIGGSIDDPAAGDFNHPTQLLFDATETHIYISAWHNSKIRIIDRSTTAISDSCGDGKRAYRGDGGPALTGSLDLPASIAWDPQGELVIMDQANQVIRFIDAAGNLQHKFGTCVIDAPAPAGPGPCATGVQPTACPAPNGKTTCGDPAVWCNSPCTPGYTGDDIPAAQMRMAQAFGQAADPGGKIVYDPQGNLYFADTTNHLIRMIDPQGMVHRVAGIPPQNGLAQPGYSGDDGPALAAHLNHPVGLSLGGDGTLYIADVLNHCIRAIAPDRTIHTVAGVCGTKGFDGDGGPATEALFNRPYGVEWTADALYIADTGNNRIRAVRLP